MSTEPERPDPEAVLRRVMKEEQRVGRGELKVFLGYASRVGKTHRMVDEMRRRSSRGQDVVVGWVSSPVSPEIQAMLDRLEAIPPRRAADGSLQMDLDAILARQPQICMVDELAHANPPGSRHSQRWQDVEALLTAGINVVTALNVQFLEDLQERVAALLGPRQRDTVPDRVIREAAEVVLVDLDPEEVRRRLAASAGPALTESVLTELRELALLYLAEAADERLEDYRSQHHIHRVWATHERIAVCITAHPRGPVLIEQGRRTAARLHAELVVLYVTPDREWSNLAVPDRIRVQETLALARTCQARVEVLVDRDPAAAILRFAQDHNITQIYIGHSPRASFFISRTVAGRIIRGADGMDVHVVAEAAMQRRSTRAPPAHSTPRQRSGRLRVYLGYAAGVGKTFQMLQEGNSLRLKGHDVVIGYLEPHGRAETLAQVGELETVPRRKVSYRDREFEEMDLQAVLDRRPEYCLVDELAHTNVPGVEHEKRWQDVLALLDSGVHVLTTVNVQHLESLNEVVYRITGVRVRETLPDWMLDEAEELVLVDVATEALLNRLKRGVVYSPAQAAAALENFFRSGNLEALRELAYRETAHAVESDPRRTPFERPGTEEAVMVAISDHPAAGVLIRRGKWMSTRLRAQCCVVFVVSDPEWSGLSAEQRERVHRHLELARTLNIETQVLYGSTVASLLVSSARERGVTQLFLGRSLRTGWREYARGNLIEQVMRDASHLDIHVVADR